MRCDDEEDRMETARAPVPEGRGGYKREKKKRPCGYIYSAWRLRDVVRRRHGAPRGGSGA